MCFFLTVLTIKTVKYRQWMSLLLWLFLFFSLKNACAGKPCQNNSTCQAGFTDRDYQCLCIAGFTGHDCEVGKKYH